MNVTNESSVDLVDVFASTAMFAVNACALVINGLLLLAYYCLRKSSRKDGLGFFAAFVAGDIVSDLARAVGAIPRTAWGLGVQTRMLGYQCLLLNVPMIASNIYLQTITTCIGFDRSLAITIPVVYKNANKKCISSWIVALMVSHALLFACSPFFLVDLHQIVTNYCSTLALVNRSSRTLVQYYGGFLTVAGLTVVILYIELLVVNHYRSRQLLSNSIGQAKASLLERQAVMLKTATTMLGLTIGLSVIPNLIIIASAALKFRAENNIRVGQLATICNGIRSAINGFACMKRDKEVKQQAAFILAKLCGSHAATAPTVVMSFSINGQNKV